MKVIPVKYDISEVKLARAVVNHMSSILEDGFDFIVEAPPDVSFTMSGRSMILNRIKFESLGLDAAIIIDEESVVLELENARPYLLYQNEGFEDLLRIDEDMLTSLDEETKKSLCNARRDYKSH